MVEQRFRANGKARSKKLVAQIGTRFFKRFNTVKLRGR